jgi:hypothetical protein
MNPKKRLEAMRGGTTTAPTPQTPQAPKKRENAWFADGRVLYWKPRPLIDLATMVITVLIGVYVLSGVYSAFHTPTTSSAPTQSRVSCQPGTASEMRFCSINDAGSACIKSDVPAPGSRFCHDSAEPIGFEWCANQDGKVSFRFRPLRRLAPEERIEVRYQFRASCPQELPEH